MRKIATICLLLLVVSPSFAANNKKIEKNSEVKKVVKESTKTTKKVALKKEIKPYVEKLILNDELLADIFRSDVRKDENFIKALDNSIGYFASIQDEDVSFKYADEAYTPAQMLKSMLLFRDLATQDVEYSEFLTEISRLFDIYTINNSYSNSMSNSVFTGYFTPMLSACSVQMDSCQTPLHLQDGSKVYVRSLTDAKSAIMEGASILHLENGDTKVITYAKTEYINSQITMLKKVKVSKNKQKFINITKHIKTPRTLFQETEEPLGSIATPLVPGYSAAMDTRFTPPGSLIYVYNKKEDGDKFERFMLVQDVGGAIKGAGRIDIYLGEGDKAEQDTFTLSKKGSVLMLVAKKEAIDTSKYASLKIPRGSDE